MEIFFTYIKYAGYYISRLNETLYFHLNIQTVIAWPVIFLMWLIYLILNNYISDKQLTALEFIKLLFYYMVILLSIIASYSNIDVIRGRANPEYAFFVITATAMVLVILIAFLGTSKDINKKARWILIALYMPVLTIILTNGRILDERSNILRDLIPRSESHFWDLRGEFDDISVGGKISAEHKKQVEEIISRFPAVKECAVVAKQDEYDRMVKPCACVVMKNSNDKTEDKKKEIKEFFRDEVRKMRLPDNMYPHWIDFVNEGKLPDMKKGKDERYNWLIKKTMEKQTKIVRKCTVLSMKDENHVNRPRAHVVLQPDIEATENLKRELGKFVIEEINKRHRPSFFMYPQWIEFYDELPKRDGTVEYYKLQKKVRNWSNYFLMNRDEED
ncbi:MAG: hypothetical protein BWK80_22065 [Desulfobacteraceae bacterium IS3]|nr:MAG: hypothetical protein BWK80_22065 [Desulfobacteraceae bacterium IS3]HAO20136.1 hypothetical protein [Desulfobacteraceae bacterium]